MIKATDLGMIPDSLDGAALNSSILVLSASNSVEIELDGHFFLNSTPNLISGSLILFGGSLTILGLSSFTPDGINLVKMRNVKVFTNHNFGSLFRNGDNSFQYMDIEGCFFDGAHLINVNKGTFVDFRVVKNTIKNTNGRWCNLGQVDFTGLVTILYNELTDVRNTGLYIDNNLLEGFGDVVISHNILKNRIGCPMDGSGSYKSFVFIGGSGSTSYTHNHVEGIYTDHESDAGGDSDSVCDAYLRSQHVFYSDNMSLNNVRGGGHLQNMIDCKTGKEFVNGMLLRRHYHNSEFIITQDFIDNLGFNETSCVFAQLTNIWWAASVSLQGLRVRVPRLVLRRQMVLAHDLLIRDCRIDCDRLYFLHNNAGLINVESSGNSTQVVEFSENTIRCRSTPIVQFGDGSTGTRSNGDFWLNDDNDGLYWSVGFNGLRIVERNDWRFFSAALAAPPAVQPQSIVVQQQDVEGSQRVVKQRINVWRGSTLNVEIEASLPAGQDRKLRFTADSAIQFTDEEMEGAKIFINEDGNIVVELSTDITDSLPLGVFRINRLSYKIDSIHSENENDVVRLAVGTFFVRD